MGSLKRRNSAANALAAIKCTPTVTAALIYTGLFEENKGNAFVQAAVIALLLNCISGLFF